MFIYLCCVCVCVYIYIYIYIHKYVYIFLIFRRFVDGIIKLVKAPFSKLFSVHAFIKSVNAIKQVPLVSILVSTKRRVDYDAVFAAISELLPQAPAVDKVVFDFGTAAWQSLRNVLAEIHFQECLFQYTQVSS